MEQSTVRWMPDRAGAGALDMRKLWFESCDKKEVQRNPSEHPTIAWMGLQSTRVWKESKHFSQRQNGDVMGENSAPEAKQFPPRKEVCGLQQRKQGQWAGARCWKSMLSRTWPKLSWLTKNWGTIPQQENESFDPKWSRVWNQEC